MMVFAINNSITGSDQKLEPRHRHHKHILDATQLKKTQDAIKNAQQAKRKIELLKLKKRREDSSKLVPLYIEDPDTSQCGTPQKLTPKDRKFLAEFASSSTYETTGELPFTPQATAEYPFSPDPKRYSQSRKLITL